MAVVSSYIRYQWPAEITQERTCLLPLFSGPIRLHLLLASLYLCVISLHCSKVVVPVSIPGYHFEHRELIRVLYLLRAHTHCG